MKYLIVIFSLTLGLNASPQGNPHYSVNLGYLMTTFHIAGDNGRTGSSFLVSYGGQEYLITAKHLFDSTRTSGSTATILVDVGHRTEERKALVFFSQESGVDAAVLILPQKLRKDSSENFFAHELNAIGMTLGQECFFLGYPDVASFQTQWGFMPVLKKCIFSGSVNNEKGSEQLLFDGFNTSGFSGGPILSSPTYELKDMGHCGVIVGFRYDGDPKSNSGLFVATPMDKVLKILESLPKR